MRLLIIAVGIASRREKVADKIEAFTQCMSSVDLTVARSCVYESEHARFFATQPIGTQSPRGWRWPIKIKVLFESE